MNDSFQVTKAKRKELNHVTGLLQRVFGIIGYNLGVIGHYQGDAKKRHFLKRDKAFFGL